MKGYKISDLVKNDATKLAAEAEAKGLKAVRENNSTQISNNQEIVYYLGLCQIIHELREKINNENK